MTGCRCCVFLTIFTLSVVFGKSFPKHVSLVKARFGSGTLWGTGRQGTARGCKDFDVQIFSWIQFVLLGTLWLGFVLTSRHTVWVPTRQSVRPPDLWPSEARVCLEIVTSLSQAL
ncbi:unnamed protein product [Effrenium voratum]|nr:unnamed protein product [Effrenium voratum]